VLEIKETEASLKVFLWILPGETAFSEKMCRIADRPAEIQSGHLPKIQ
jgi:hypothetical protein